MWALSAAARSTLRSSHSVDFRLTAYTARNGVLTSVPFSGGSVSADAKSMVRRTAALSIADPTLWPADGFDALSPLGSELLVEYGIVVPGKGTEWVPLIRGPIQKASGSRPATGPIPLEVADYSKRVAEDRLDTPRQTTAGSTCVAAITELLTEAMPGVTVLDLTGSTQSAPVLDIDKERWSDGVEKLADAMAAEVYADPTGRFVIRPQPTLDDPPVWLVDAGETGVLIKADLELTRERVFNAVIAVGERSDGTPPVWAKVVDDDPDSPTRYGGPFGRKPRFYSSPLLTTTGQCTAAAAALLARVKGYAATVKIQTVPNPALEPGDVIEVRMPDGSRQRHIIDQVPVPLSATDTQTLATRSADLPAEQ